MLPAAALLLQVQTSGSYLTGAALLRACTSAAAFDRADCLGYVTGIADAIGAAQPVLRDRFAIPATVCVPPGTTRARLRDIAVAHLRQADAGAGAGAVVVEALMHAFPCPGTEGAQ